MSPHQLTPGFDEQQGIVTRTCARTLERAAATRPSSAGPNGSSARRTVESDGGVPNTAA